MKNGYILFCVIACSALGSCKKYLDQKPDKALTTPNSVEDLQAVLDFNTVMNLQHPSIGESSADDYFVSQASVGSLRPSEKNAYLWDTAAYDYFPNDWALCYQPVYSANLVLTNISAINRTTANASAWDQAKGAALFFRATGFLTALWNWAKAYDEGTAATDMGIPLRLTDDFNRPSVRASVKVSYRKVLDDLLQATGLLPNQTSHVMRPSRAAAYAMLARVYLSMRLYDSCLKYAGLALQIKSDLLDYNTLSAAAIYPFKQFNSEVLFESRMNLYINLQKGRMDTTLMAAYDSADLRKTLFYKKEADGYYSFRGSYDGSRFPFTGITTAELLLIQAESKARLKNTDGALSDLNTLLKMRYKAGKFQPVQTLNADDLVKRILDERRKELVFRDLRWIDIKRLNKESAGITVKRIIDAKPYALLPNANRFALPLPLDLISMSGMQQNPY